jgi:hypothetical protein
MKNKMINKIVNIFFPTVFLSLLTQYIQCIHFRIFSIGLLDFAAYCKAFIAGAAIIFLTSVNVLKLSVGT